MKTIIISQPGEASEKLNDQYANSSLILHYYTIGLFNTLQNSAAGVGYLHYANYKAR